MAALAPRPSPLAQAQAQAQALRFARAPDRALGLGLGLGSGLRAQDALPWRTRGHARPSVPASGVATRSRARAAPRSGGVPGGVARRCAGFGARRSTSVGALLVVRMRCAGAGLLTWLHSLAAGTASLAKWRNLPMARVKVWLPWQDDSVSWRLASCGELEGPLFYLRSLVVGCISRSTSCRRFLLLNTTGSALSWIGEASPRAPSLALERVRRGSSQHRTQMVSIRDDVRRLSLSIHPADFEHSSTAH